RRTAATARATAWTTRSGSKPGLTSRVSGNAGVRHGRVELARPSPPLGGPLPETAVAGDRAAAAAARLDGRLLPRRSGGAVRLRVLERRLPHRAADGHIHPGELPPGLQPPRRPAQH